MRRSSRGTSVLALLLMVAVCMHRPIRSQDVRIDRLQQSAAGGHMQGDGFSVFSSVGSAAPSGVSQNEVFGISSGARSLIDPISSPVLRFTHSPVGVADEGTEFEIFGSVLAEDLVERAIVRYRRGGDVEYAVLDMSERSPNELHASVPGDAVTSRGVAYHVEVVDDLGRTIRQPLFGDYGVAVRVGAPGLSSAQSLPGGSEQGAYRLVSVPLLLDAPDPESVLADDFGPYDPEQWRFFELRFDQSVLEYPNTGAVRPGQAFWLITREAQQTFDTGEGVSLSPVVSHSLLVHPQWSLIGNPYNFPISVQGLSFQSGGPVELRAYNGAWNDPINERVTELRPFSGYAVYNPSPIVDTLEFDPRPSQEFSSTGKTLSARTSNQLDWSIGIAAHSGQARDADNIAGASENALVGRDPMDHPEPPGIGTFVSLYFAHPEWGGMTSSFSTDIRPTTSSSESWDFEVTSNTRKAVHLTFRRVESVPDHYRVLLVDELAGVITDLRRTPSYVLSEAGSAEPRRLRLIVGTDASVSEMTPDVDAVPGGVELAPVFPNPVGASMTIRYGLPEPADLTLRLYNAAGRLIQEIARHRETEGYHTLVWASSGRGEDLASGVYLLELRAGGVRRARTITMIR